MIYYYKILLIFFVRFNIKINVTFNIPPWTKRSWFQHFRYDSYFRLLLGLFFRFAALFLFLIFFNTFNSLSPLFFFFSKRSWFQYLEKIPTNPTLKTSTEGHSWKLKFIKIGQDYCFAHWWDKLAEDVHLSIRDIVVFSLIDPFTFQVSFLGANGCCKHLPLNNKTSYVSVFVFIYIYI